jgi:hypothetical protein
VRAAAAAGTARLRAKVTGPPVLAEGGHPRLGYEDDVAATSAIAAIGTAARHVGFTPERGGAVTAVTGRDEDAGVVGEHPAMRIATVCDGAESTN